MQFNMQINSLFFGELRLIDNFEGLIFWFFLLGEFQKVYNQKQIAKESCHIECYYGQTTFICFKTFL